MKAEKRGGLRRSRSPEIRLEGARHGRRMIARRDEVVPQRGDEQGVQYVQRTKPAGIEVRGSEERLEEHQYEDTDRHADHRSTHPTNDGCDQHRGWG